MPVQLTRLVGREGALGDLRSLVWQTRLLCLCGPGGAGKTRLAVGLGEAVRPDFVGGAWWVDLSSTLDPELVGQAVVSTLIPDEPAADATAAAIAREFAEATLLVLDNCEHVVDGCAELVMSLLERAPALRVLATSRQPLGLPGEHVWRVPGLTVRRPDDPGPGGGLSTPDGGAVELFLERAGAASRSFAADDPATIDAAMRICRWLDGMPLAIELAAARVSLLGVEQIAGRLERDASFLRQRNRAAPARHQTLPATLEWSHRMLDDAEQRLFRRLATFRGSFSLAAAEAVGADGIAEEQAVLDLLGALVDRSLVHVVEISGEPRYRLLMIVRQYAAELLDRSGEGPAARARHARFFSALAQNAAQAIDQDQQAGTLELEHDNLSEALHWLMAESPEDAARLASLLWPFWYRRGYYQEARLWLDEALSASSEISEPELATALIRGGEVAFMQCDYAVAIERLQRGLELARGLDDRRLAATALQRLGSIAREQGRYGEARDLHARSLAIWNELPEPAGIAASENYLGFVAWLDGDPWSAESLCSTALRHFQSAGDPENAAQALVNLGACALYRGELGLAAERLDEALVISRRLDFQEVIAWSQHELAIVGRRRRRPVHENAALLRSALLIHRRLGDRWRVASVLEELAGAQLGRQDARLAVEVLAAADALRSSLGTPIPPAESADRDVAVARLKSNLSATAFASAWSDGHAAELDRVIDRVLGELRGEHGHAPAPSPAAAPGAAGAQSVPVLTRRELAVLELLSAGHTNREIAAALYISPSTAGVHVSNVLRKLGAKRRVDAAGQAHRLGLLRPGRDSSAVRAE